VDCSPPLPFLAWSYPLAFPSGPCTGIRSRLSHLYLIFVSAWSFDPRIVRPRVAFLSSHSRRFFWSHVGVQLSPPLFIYLWTWIPISLLGFPEILGQPVFDRMSYHVFFPKGEFISGERGPSAIAPYFALVLASSFLSSFPDPLMVRAATLLTISRELQGLS